MFGGKIIFLMIISEPINDDLWIKEMRKMYKHLKFLDGYKYLLPRFSSVIAPFVYFSCQKYVSAPNIPSSTSSHISGMTAFK